MSDMPRAHRPGLRGRLSGLISSEGLKARVFRGAFLSMGSFGGSQLMRLVSNLVLTRLLFPEAFGLMALVQVVLTGLELFSDSGLRISVVQNAKGDDENFLNTVWTIKVIRGVILWLLACALALPMAAIYNEPAIAQLLPVAGLSLIISGAFPSAVAVADRHLRLGRVTTAGLAGQAVGISSMILLAILLESVWALAIGSIVGALAKQVLYRVLLPNSGNCWNWDKDIVTELFQFGKWILFGTAFGFVAKNADKVILGRFVSIADLGIYNIGFFLAMFTFSVTQAVRSKVLMPIYRMRPIHESEENRKKIFFVRRLIIICGMSLTVVMCFIGIPLVEFLYDDRYALAGPIVVLLSLSVVPQMIVIGTGDLMLVSGDSRRAMHLTALMAVVQTICLLIGVQYFGIAGVVLARGIATILTHPVRIHYMRKYDGWDVWGDLLLFLAGIVPVGIGCWMQADALAALFP